jgi:hypothetical protein
MEHLSYFQYGRGKLNEHLRRRNSFSRAVHGIEAVSSLRGVHAEACRARCLRRRLLRAVDGKRIFELPTTQESGYRKLILTTKSLK